MIIITGTGLDSLKNRETLGSGPMALSLRKGEFRKRQKKRF